MTLGVYAQGILEAFERLPQHAEDAANAPPGHPFFGAAFLFIGSLLVVETLAGGVWRRNRLRTMLWPGVLVAAGLGMVIVAYVQPTDKALHLALAFVLLVGGFIEARQRQGLIQRSTADILTIPALIFGGLVIGPMHTNGPVTSSVTAQTHLLVGFMGFALAGIRLSQVRFGPTIALETTFGAGVMMLGLSLLLVQQFHGGH
jgi:hypothetical protein